MDDVKYYTRPNLYNDGTDTDIYYIGKKTKDVLFEYSYTRYSGLAEPLSYRLSLSVVREEVFESMTYITKEEYDAKLNYYRLQDL